MRLELATILLLGCCAVLADDGNLDITGHSKLRGTLQTFPDDSLFRDLLGKQAAAAGGELRLNLEWNKRRWSVDAGYQLLLLHGDELLQRPPTDDRRWFNLTDVISEGGKNTAVHRLDRLFISYASEKAVVLFGRQALSWGNGMFYAPMDLVNPFDPATIDTEYKTGDDMLYTQYLQDNGNDIQGAVVIRRNLLSGDVEYDQGTVAVKYHGFSGEREYDLLLAESYGDLVIGAGMAGSLGGAAWGADLVWTDADDDQYVQLVANLSYSWMGWDRNMSGAIEYYYNGNSNDIEQIARGQLFGLGRHYLAGSIMFEMTPLWTLTPTLLCNVEDPSALLQIQTGYSLSDNATFLGSVNLPVGGNGTEFGGLDSGIPGRYLSTGAGLFAQIAWYF